MSPVLTLPVLALSETWFMAAVLFGVVLLFSLVLLLITRYKRCPSNKILVVYGKVGGGQASKCLHGGGAFVIPLIQDYDFLDLEPIQIEIPLRGALSASTITRAWRPRPAASSRSWPRRARAWAASCRPAAAPRPPSRC